MRYLLLVLLMGCGPSQGGPGICTREEVKRSCAAAAALLASCCTGSSSYALCDDETRTCKPWETYVVDGAQLCTQGLPDPETFCDELASKSSCGAARDYLWAVTNDPEEGSSGECCCPSGMICDTTTPNGACIEPTYPG